ncbi:hypothetical protein B0H66DRAFT_560838 [Apodospora peruviana]|uniref:Lytic polysaccharide monooxygenase n=1 Tax=Apodospora peruviana TaxID=516989 RepID=A0AAE0I0C1_9PEZI|nr:hypothetical protein B0H66DRAFT_560838 [Apodospora peruviana]
MILAQTALGLLWLAKSSLGCTPPNCLASETLEPRFFKDEAKSQRVLKRYGPFTAPGMSDHHGMKQFVSIMAPPCNDCLVTHIQAGLEYPNGSYANVNTGMWLHHVVVVNMNRSSTVCPSNAEPMFASGNERTAANICVNGTQKAGYHILPTDTTFALVAELMNDKMEARDAVVTIDWEFVPASSASSSSFKHATPIWLDIDGICPGSSEVPVPDGGSSKVFSLSLSPPWTSSFSAEILWVMSHLHDGGETLQVTKNSSPVVCDSVARYGETDAYVVTEVHDHNTPSEGGSGSGHHGGQHGVKRRAAAAPAHTTRMTHISSMSSCALLGKQMNVGDEWTITANYNLTDHAPMTEGDGLAPVMGISIMYVVKG